MQILVVVAPVFATNCCVVVAGPDGQLQLQRVEAAVVVRGGAFEPVKGR